MIANLRHLYIFSTTARCGSINAAARAVHLSQPAVTQAIAAVERYFSVALFNRSSVGVSLSAAGASVLARVDRALHQLHDGIDELTRSAPRTVRSQDVVRVVTAAQLRALIAVAEHRSFTLAARAIDVAQPTIHRAARELERIVGTPLFERTSFGVVPTREAQKFARRARLAFAEIAQARVEIDAIKGGETGTTVIGSMPLARTYLLPTTLIEFTTEFPEHGVSIMEGPYETLLSALRGGDADFLIGAMRDPPPLPDVVQEYLFDDPLAIILRPQHPLANKRRVSVAMLARFPWVAARAGTPLRAHFNELFVNAKIEPPRRPIECNSLIAARALLMESDRLMLLSRHQIHYELKAGLLTALPHPQPDIARPIGLTTRRDWLPTTAQQRLIEMLRQRTRNLHRE